jgi:hypothetical protein
MSCEESAFGSDVEPLGGSAGPVASFSRVLGIGAGDKAFGSLLTHPQALEGLTGILDAALSRGKATPPADLRGQVGGPEAADGTAVSATIDHVNVRTGNSSPSQGNRILSDSSDHRQQVALVQTT